MGVAVISARGLAVLGEGCPGVLNTVQGAFSFWTRVLCPALPFAPSRTAMHLMQVLEFRDHRKWYSTHTGAATGC